MNPKISIIPNSTLTLTKIDEDTYNDLKQVFGKINKEILQKNSLEYQYLKYRKYQTDKNDPFYYISNEYLESLIKNNNIRNHAEFSSCEKLKYLNVGPKLMPMIIKLFPNYYIYNSGAFYYKKNDFMSWHTNINDTGNRLYVTWSDENDKSFFRYKHPITHEIITDYDIKDELNFRLFDINNSNPFWHCVGSNCNRISIGFNINHK